MKKFTKKLKGKKVLSLVLAAIMLATTFSVAMPVLKLDTNAAEMTYDGEGNIIIDGVTQKQIVTKDNANANLNTSKYDEYAASYLGGAAYSTGIVIPGLDAAQDYVIQGMTYYPKRDWFLVTAYHNDGTASSKVFALDASTGKFVAMISFLNPDESVNMDHGGGIAVSEHNLYYSCGDKDRTIAYVPLSELDKVEENTHAQIKLKGKHDFVEIGSIANGDKTAYSAYVCYDDGILWMGNFYDKGAKLIGLTIAAADYNAPSNGKYNSMVFGYRLSGSTSEEEWANLTGSAGKDCQGSPSYALGLNNALKDVQYATVHEGKLYLSRSYGSGAGNSLNFGFGETSNLTVADIDLSIPGNTSVTISTKSTGSLDKTINAYDISSYKDYPMMPMSEGLCVVDDEIFITFEGASNKYLNESDGPTSIGNCEKPVDVIWQLNPYELMEQEVAEPEKSIYYEKVNSVEEIESGAEYIIVHQSPEKDPVTQEQILYALNADGNFKGYKLSKGTASAAKGYNGMIGHAITDYDLVDEDNNGSAEKLYLNNPDKDDVENVRWTLTKGDGTNCRITTTEPYFANCNNLYFDKNTISMLPGTATSKLAEIKFQQSNNGKGGFWLANNDAYFLWCNDGGYNATINTYYANNKSSTPIYDGISEQPGTFHCDALNSSGSNIIGASVPDANSYSDRVFYIFKRKVDETSSTYESRVYTGFNAEVEADGTYTVDFETYAISPNHYKYVGEKPTDYIIVADTSESMASTGSTGYQAFSGDLGVKSFFSSSDQLGNTVGKPQTTTGSEDGTPIIGYAFSYEDIYYLHDDGNFYKLYMALRTEYSYTDPVKVGSWVISEGSWSMEACHFYLYYISGDGIYHCFAGNEAKPSYSYTEEQFNAWVGNADLSLATGMSSNSITNTAKDRYATTFSAIPHYRFDNVNSQENFAEEHTRIQTLKDATSNLIGQIAAENSQNRIALVQFGADASTGYYNTSSTRINTGYKDALWSAGNASGLQTIASNLTTSTQTTNNNAFPIVNSIIANSGETYVGEKSTRNVAVIYLSDGVAGADGQSDDQYKAAANEIIPEALETKRAGAFIYTVMIGADGTQYGRNTFMEAISSKYAEAASMTDLGGQSVDGVNYTLSLATATMENFVNFGAVTLKEISANNAVGLESLNNFAFIRQELNDCFNYDNADCSVELITGRFDAIGRFAFDETGIDATDEGVTVNFVDGKRYLTVTGYNYADEYIGKGRDGRMLRVRITGLLPKDNAVIQHEPISNLDTTAVYKSKDDMNASTAQNDLSFKKIPTEFANINEYTYVLDYGLQMLDMDVNGTLCAVSNSFSVQDAENNYINAKTALDGDIAIQSGDENLLYSMSPDVGTTNHIGYTLIKRPEGNYDWFKIKLVPASNVYFEETEFAKDAGTGTVAWEKTTGGTSAPYRFLPGEDDPVGYDAAYDNTNTYSNGTALSATVDSTNKRSKTATVSFKGNGIDIISACGPTTGMQIINIKNAQGKSVAASIVDTYYQDDTFTQVPVFSWRGNADPDEIYTVETTAVYLSTAGALKKSGFKSSLIDTGLVMNTADDLNTPNVQAMLDAAGVEDIDAENLELVWFDDNSVLNGGTGVAPTKKGARAGETSSVTLNNYIDGFRIYNPLGSNHSTDYEASEQGSMYYNVIDSLADGTLSHDGSLDGTVAFVTGELAEGETLDFANYESIGPKNELYLKGNATNGVTFKTPFVDGVKVMVSLRAVNGATTVNINGTEFAIKSATEMYYDITDLLKANADSTATVSITNSGSGILAVNNIKLTNTVSGAGLMELNGSDIETVRYHATMEPVQATVENGVVTPVVDEEVPEDNTNTDTETEGFDIFSFVEMLIAFIEKILSSSFGTGNIF